MFQACYREYSLIARHVDFTRAVTAREVFSLRPGLVLKSFKSRVAYSTSSMNGIQEINFMGPYHPGTLCSNKQLKTGFGAAYTVFLQDQFYKYTFRLIKLIYNNRLIS